VSAPHATHIGGLVQDPAAMRERFFHSDRQDEGGKITETIGQRPDMVWEMQGRILAEEAGPDVAFQGALEVAHLNRMLRATAQAPGAHALQKPPSGAVKVLRETKVTAPTARPPIVRFI
jgi:hypothetical protein